MPTLQFPSTVDSGVGRRLPSEGERHTFESCQVRHFHRGAAAGTPAKRGIMAKVSVSGGDGLLHELLLSRRVKCQESVGFECCHASETGSRHGLTKDAIRHVPSSKQPRHAFAFPWLQTWPLIAFIVKLRRRAGFSVPIWILADRLHGPRDWPPTLLCRRPSMPRRGEGLPDVGRPGHTMSTGINTCKIAASQRNDTR